MKAAASDRAPRKRAVCPPLLKTRILIFSPAQANEGATTAPARFKGGMAREGSTA
eukprot:CAMPEP_0179838676 /NCGR_PEP_ID=MMETSP0982-20121206/838_1 /TAXON_ID=483367 /ORGANISM="non described non described, Strain CCMP 2436" /LENGTH=54 /DNA_ID=CAMNT_0021722133 /DNA_START=433 /DNA_END=595 /DNA_ORIENTATION=-